MTPTRSGVPRCACASAITSATFSGPPMLPGFRRTQCAPASIAFSASVWLKWMSAIIGIGDCATIVFSASTSCSRGTATRTMSAPASATVADLVHRRREVRGLGLRHRLHRDRRAAADRDRADVDLALGGHRPILAARRVVKDWGGSERSARVGRPDARDPLATSRADVYATAADRSRASPRRSPRAPARAATRASSRSTRLERGRAGARRRLRRASACARWSRRSTSPASTSPSGPTTRGRSCRPTRPRGCRSRTASSTSSTARA